MKKQQQQGIEQNIKKMCALPLAEGTKRKKRETFQVFINIYFFDYCNVILQSFFISNGCLRNVMNSQELSTFGL